MPDARISKRIRKLLPDYEPEISIRDRDYLIAIDETGNEDFRGSSLFGFAGVAGFGSELRRASVQWGRMKTRHFGSEESPLHASGEKMKPSQVSAVGDFFQASPLKRFAYLLDSPGIQIGAYDAITYLIPYLREELMRHIADLPKVPERVAVGFELSDRVTPKLMDQLPGIELSIDDLPVEVFYFFTPKWEGSAVLEMADQVAHRAQRQHKELRSSSGLLPEFMSVFPERSSKALYRMMELKKVEATDGSWKVELLDNGGVRISGVSGRSGLL